MSKKIISADQVTDNNPFYYDSDSTERSDDDEVFLVNPGDMDDCDFVEKKIELLTKVIPKIDACNWEGEKRRGFAKPMTEIADEVDYMPTEALRELRKTNKDEYDAYNARHRMERIYLRAFKHNMSLNEKGLLDRFVHVISVDRLMLLIANEFKEKDLIRMFDSINIY